MVTYAIFKSESGIEAINLTNMVEEVLQNNPDYDYITAVIVVAETIEATQIISDETHEKIALMFPNAKIFDYKGGDLN
jgi:hypothetical protein